MTGAQLILTGQVDEQVPIETLNEAMVLLEFQIGEIKQNQWGPMGQAQIVAHQRLIETIQDRLNRHHGMDGMTPIPR